MSAAFAHLMVDPELLVAARNGEHLACEKLFRQFETPVYNLAARICQNRDEAYDILQEVFVQTFSRIDQFRDEAPFWAWLRQATVNRCLSHLRTARRNERRISSSADQSAPVESPADQIDLAQAFARLPAETRTVLWLYDVEGYSHQEIAELFGKSISFSKTQVSRAHRRLRDWLDQEDESSLCPQIVPAN